ncbi:MAG TPA: exodeoxyribonuclease VII large subunit [Gammaproteobacteria bacterium]|nr:exodeoxyribonuclease VII large subunit [Gammaproteobacteria bacterium]
MQTAAPQRHVYTVTALNREVGELLAHSFPLLWVEGEISNLSQPRSGHMYFSLKDGQTQVRAAMFRNRNTYLGFPPVDGMQVLVRAKVSLYEPRGDFQLIVEHMEKAGDGALQRAFEALKQKLGAAGLFDAARKRPLPPFPSRIGVITSPTGAALRDVLSVLRRRYPLAEVLIYPVQVQGAEAARDIINTLNLASARGECEVLLLVRGGGSLEDLSAFNDEQVAHAIAACAIPVISGIGHEVDFTIADFVADLRAPTPSAAAELASPDGPELARQALRLGSTLKELMLQRLRDLASQLGQNRKRLEFLHPARQLVQQQQSLDEWERRLRHAMNLALGRRASGLGALEHRMTRYSPVAPLLRLSARAAQLQQRLGGALRLTLQRKTQQLALAAQRLDSVSPLATLQRGYALVRDSSGQPIRRSRDTETGARLDIHLAEGGLEVRVEHKK